MEEERIFSSIEVNCFPKGCLLDKFTQTLLAINLIPKLEDSGMKMPEWTRGALLLEEPHFSKVKSIVCKGCNVFNCQFSSRISSFNGLRSMKNGRYEERIEKGDKFLAMILPEEKKKMLEKKGIDFSAFHMPSRKNPQLVFRFTFGDKILRVSCEIGKGILSTKDGEEPLRSLDQLRTKIDEAINALI